LPTWKTRCALIPDITDVAAAGWRDNLEGCAVLVSTVPVTLDDVRSHLSGLGMTEWYWPTRVERVEALPRNQMGKVERARPRAWLASETGLATAAGRTSRVSRAG
jgi:cyclohexanecarboxylate-CoA ligase